MRVTMLILGSGCHLRYNNEMKMIEIKMADGNLANRNENNTSHDQQLNLKSCETQLSKLMDHLRERSHHQSSWMETVKVLHTSLSSDKRSLSVDNLQRNVEILQSAVKVTTLSYVVERLEVISKQVGLQFIKDTVNDLRIGCDMFCVRLLLSPTGAFKDVQIVHGIGVRELPTSHSTELRSCSDLLESLKARKYDDLLQHLQGLVTLYDFDTDKKAKKQLFLAVQSLEADLISLSKLQSGVINVTSYIHKTPLGLVSPRSGGLPMKLTYFVGPYDLLNHKTHTTTPMTIEAIHENNIGYSLTVGIEKSSVHRLQTVPLVVNANKANDRSSPTVNSVGNGNSCLLPAVFVLNLHRPLPVSTTILDNIRQVAGVECVVSSVSQSLTAMLVEQMIHVKLKDHDTLDTHSVVVLPGGQVHRYYVAKSSNSAGLHQGVLVTKILFSLPTSVPSIVLLLRQQALFNTVLLSCLRPSPSVGCSHVCGPLSFDVTPLSIQHLVVTFEHPFSQSLMTVELDLSDVASVKCQLVSDDCVCSDDFASKIFQRCLSLPITLRAVLSKAASELPRRPLHPSTLPTIPVGSVPAATPTTPSTQLTQHRLPLSTVSQLSLTSPLSSSLTSLTSTLPGSLASLASLHDTVNRLPLLHRSLTSHITPGAVTSSQGVTTLVSLHSTLSSPAHTINVGSLLGVTSHSVGSERSAHNPMLASLLEPEANILTCSSATSSTTSGLLETLTGQQRMAVKRPSLSLETSTIVPAKRQLSSSGESFQFDSNLFPLGGRGSTAPLSRSFSAPAPPGTSPLPPGIIPPGSPRRPVVRLDASLSKQITQPAQLSLHGRFDLLKDSEIKTEPRPSTPSRTPRSTTSELLNLLSSSEDIEAKTTDSSHTGVTDSPIVTCSGGSALNTDNIASLFRAPNRSSCTPPVSSVTGGSRCTGPGAGAAETTTAGGNGTGATSIVGCSSEAGDVGNTWEMVSSNNNAPGSTGDELTRSRSVTPKNHQQLSAAGGGMGGGGMGGGIGGGGMGGGGMGGAGSGATSGHMLQAVKTELPSSWDDAATSAVIISTSHQHHVDKPPITVKFKRGRIMKQSGQRRTIAQSESAVDRAAWKEQIKASHSIKLNSSLSESSPVDSLDFEVDGLTSTSSTPGMTCSPVSPVRSSSSPRLLHAGNSSVLSVAGESMKAGEKRPRVAGIKIPGAPLEKRLKRNDDSRKLSRKIYEFDDDTDNVFGATNSGSTPVNEKISTIKITKSQGRLQIHNSSGSVGVRPAGPGSAGRPLTTVHRPQQTSSSPGGLTHLPLVKVGRPPMRTKPSPLAGRSDVRGLSSAVRLKQSLTVAGGNNNNSNSSVVSVSPLASNTGNTATGSKSLTSVVKSGSMSGTGSGGTGSGSVGSSKVKSLSGSIGAGGTSAGKSKGSLSAVIDKLTKSAVSGGAEKDLYDAIRLEIIREGNKPSTPTRDLSSAGKSTVPSTKRPDTPKDPIPRTPLPSIRKPTPTPVSTVNNTQSAVDLATTRGLTETTARAATESSRASEPTTRGASEPRPASGSMVRFTAPPASPPSTTQDRAVRTSSEILVVPKIPREQIQASSTGSSSPTNTTPRTSAVSGRQLADPSVPAGPIYRPTVRSSLPSTLPGVMTRLPGSPCGEVIRNKTPELMSQTQRSSDMTEARLDDSLDRPFPTRHFLDVVGTHSTSVNDITPTDTSQQTILVDRRLSPPRSPSPTPLCHTAPAPTANYVDDDRTVEPITESTRRLTDIVSNETADSSLADGPPSSPHRPPTNTSPQHRLPSRHTSPPRRPSVQPTRQSSPLSNPGSPTASLIIDCYPGTPVIPTTGGGAALRTGQQSPVHPLLPDSSPLPSTICDDGNEEMISPNISDMVQQPLSPVVSDVGDMMQQPLSPVVSDVGDMITEDIDDDLMNEVLMLSAKKL